ncbi:MAG TPA: DinB family protein [Thermoanaerobaculia bacterium]|jgi:hypothetical protein|nr:DinB family protein [Thermoanaerobaculia bacterium]
MSIDRFIQRPPVDEYAPFYQGYIAEIPDDDILGRMCSQEEVVSKLPAAVSESGETFAYAPDKWTVRQVVGHLCDCERVFGYRAFRVSRGDLTPLPGFDENAYVANSNSASRHLQDSSTNFRFFGEPTYSFSRRWSRAAGCTSESQTLIPSRCAPSPSSSWGMSSTISEFFVTATMSDWRWADVQRAVYGGWSRAAGEL